MRAAFPARGFLVLTIITAGIVSTLVSCGAPILGSITIESERYSGTSWLTEDATTVQIPYAIAVSNNTELFTSNVQVQDAFTSFGWIEPGGPVPNIFELRESVDVTIELSASGNGGEVVFTLVDLSLAPIEVSWTIWGTDSYGDEEITLFAPTIDFEITPPAHTNGPQALSSLTLRRSFTGPVWEWPVTVPSGAEIALRLVDDETAGAPDSEPISAATTDERFALNPVVPTHVPKPASCAGKPTCSFTVWVAALVGQGQPAIELHGPAGVVVQEPVGHELILAEQSQTLATITSDRPGVTTFSGTLVTPEPSSPVDAITTVVGIVAYSLRDGPIGDFRGLLSVPDVQFGSEQNVMTLGDCCDAMSVDFNRSVPSRARSYDEITVTPEVVVQVWSVEPQDLSLYSLTLSEVDQ